MSLEQNGQWPSIAEAFLTAVGHPLRPIEPDLNNFKHFSDPIPLKHDSPKALILGVTPELHTLLSPSYSVFAMDRTEDMIKHVWPGNPENVIRKNWLDLEQLDQTFELILLDGGLHLVQYPEEQQKLLSAISSKLKSGGRFITRLFTPPKKRESVEEVMTKFKQGTITSINQLKIKLGNALQSSARDGVILDDIWKTVEKNIPDFEDIGSQLGWTQMELKALHFYRNLPARYSFVTLEEVIEMANKASTNMTYLGVKTPHYTLGEQFPCVCFNKTT